jgi:hypothetical protein
LRMLAQGQPSRVIGNALKISEQTVKNHVEGLLRKLVADGVALVLCLSSGWLRWRRETVPILNSDQRPALLPSYTLGHQAFQLQGQKSAQTKRQGLWESTVKSSLSG